MAEEFDPKLGEWTERLIHGEAGAAAARDSLFDAVCAALGATPEELAAATAWCPRQPDGTPRPIPPFEAASSDRGFSRGSGTAPRFSAVRSRG